MVDARTITLADPKGRWFGTYGVRRCPAHADRNPSLSVRDGADGRLLLRCHAGCAFEDILAALGLKGGARPAAPDPAELARRAAEAEKAEAERIRRAVRLWEEAEPVGGTLAEAYLRHRAIRSPLPDTLRFHRGAYNGETGRRLPALVAKVVDAAGRHTGAHLTFLGEPGAKAALTQPRIMHGRCKSGAVRLSGPSETLVVGEGLETMLSVRDDLRERDVAVWAALSAPNLAALDLPPGLREVVVAADNDPAGLRAADALGERCHARGVPCRMMVPPEGFGDFNDVAMAAVEVSA